MANSTTGFTNTLLAWDAGVIQAEINRIQAVVGAKVNPFSGFATRFENIPSGTGVINVPIPTYSTTCGKNSYTITDATTTNAPLTLNTDYTKFVAFNPAEAQTAGLTNLVNTFIAPAIYAVEAQLTTDAYALLTSFATCSVKPAAAVTMSGSNALAIQSALSTAGINGERILVLNSSYFWNGIMTDLSKQNNSAGAAAIASGAPNNPYGFTGGVMEAQLLPTAGNLVGFTGTKGGIVVGTAIPNVVHANGSSVVIQSPTSGLNLLVEHFYDESNRKWVIGASVIGAVATGNTGAVQRIVSA